jgi:outer membrane protein OmpA-like peptidoglycan-associated protein
LGLNYRQLPPKTVVETVALPVYTAEVSDDELDKIIEVEPEPEPEPEAAPLAEVTQAEIVIRDMLQFEVGNDRLVPTSIPTLQAVAQLLNDNPDIQTLVVEGHASGEGTFESNYELSVRRSLAVFRELVKLDVHPSRLAIRGFGEVVPLVEGDDTKNRRVVFSIARRLAPNEPNPGWSTEVTLPWSGEARAIPAAKLPELAPVVPDKRAPKVEESTIDKSHFDEEDDD